MTCWKSVVLASAVVAAASQGVTANDDHHHGHRARQRVVVSFATATTPAIPGVVNFLVAGFHQIFVYNPGVTPADIQAFLAMNDPTNANL